MELPARAGASTGASSRRPQPPAAQPEGCRSGIHLPSRAWSIRATVCRPPAGRWRTSTGPAQLIARAADRAQQAGLAIVAQLAAKIANVHVDHIRHREKIEVPHVLRDLCAGEHAVRIAREVLEDCVLLARQLDEFPCAADL